MKDTWLKEGAVMKIYQEYTKEKYCGAEYADKAVVKKKLTRINLTDKQYSKGGIPVITEGNDVYLMRRTTIV